MALDNGFVNSEQRLKTLLNYAFEIGFPKYVVKELVQSYKDLLPIKNSLKVDYKIEKVRFFFNI